MDFGLDLDWCLACGQHTLNGVLYCSPACLASDAAAARSSAAAADAWEQQSAAHDHHFHNSSQQHSQTHSPATYPHPQTRNTHSQHHHSSQSHLAYPQAPKSPQVHSIHESSSFSASPPMAPLPSSAFRSSYQHSSARRGSSQSDTSSIWNAEHTASRKSSIAGGSTTRSVSPQWPEPSTRTTRYPHSNLPAANVNGILPLKNRGFVNRSPSPQDTGAAEWWEL